MRFSGTTIAWLAGSGLLFSLSPFLPELALLALAADGLLLVLIITDAMILRNSVRISGRREHGDILSLGVSNPVRVVVENAGAFPLRLAVRDGIPDHCESDRAEDHARLPAYGAHQFTYHLIPFERGQQVFGPLTARVRTTLGFWIAQRELLSDGAIKVYPNIQQTGQQLLSRQTFFRQPGVRSMRLRGQGMEFESLRDYLPDDELRKVDWKASARRGNLVTRAYDIERSQQIMIALDMGRMMASHLDYMTKLDHAINAAVLLTYVSGQSYDRVGVMAFADEVISYMPPGKGGAQLPRVLEQLYPLQPRQVESNYYHAFSYLANRLRKRSLIIIFSDLIDPDASKRLIDNIALLKTQHLVLCVALSDYELQGLLGAAPTDEDALYRQAMASTMLEDRRMALSVLHQHGILTVDAAPSDLSVAVVNQYLAIKREGRL